MSKITSVFLIDDDCDDREIFSAVLSSIDRNISLITAADGAEALEKIKTKEIEKVDLIFLDLNMPKLDGMGFLKKIKEKGLLRNVPIIIYSTARQEKYIEETLALGAFTYLSKTNTMEALSSALKNLFAVV